MTLKQMNYFLSVANTGNMTKSAEQLFVTQPTLSLSVRELEKEVGTPLFQKKGNRLYLTEAGDALRDQCAQILQQYQLMQARIQSGSLNKNYVRFGFSTIVGNAVSPEICCQFLRHYPSIRLETMEDYGPALLYKLISGQLDVVITGGSYALSEQWADHFCFMPLHPSGMEFFVRADHPLVQKERVTMEEISKIPTIMLDETVPISRLIQNAFFSKNMALNVITRSKDIYTVERFISLGVGGGFLPPESGTLNSAIRPLPCPELSSLQHLSTGLYWRKDNLPSYALQCFIDIAKKLYGEPSPSA